MLERIVKRISMLTAAYPNHKSPLLLPGLIGFIFVFRTCLTLLWFKADPQQGTTVNVAISLILLILAAFSSIGAAPSLPSSCFRTQTIRWIAAFLTLALLSIAWSDARPLAAGGYWASLAANVATVWLVLRCRQPEQQAAAIMKGAIWGASLVALIAWRIPAMDDLRLGNEDFLHPNIIGFLTALTALLAMHLAHENKFWRGPALWLTITLLRSLSKTSIIAFVLAAGFYLVWDSTLTRAARIKIALASTVLLAFFWSLFDAYLEVYAQGTSPETLTGRTLIWAVTGRSAMEKPWFGHGFYSYRSIIPPFGEFEASHAHNELLQQFFSYGIAGAVLVVGIYWAFYRQIRQAPPSHLKTLAASLLIFALVRGLADTDIVDLSCPLWLMTMLSILLCSAMNNTAEARH